LPALGWLRRRVSRLAYIIHNPDRPAGMRSGPHFSVARAADYIVVHTHHGLEECVRRGIPEEKLKVIPHGTLPLLTRLHEPPPSDPKLLCVLGRRPDQGGAILEQALKTVHSDTVDLVTVLGSTRVAGDPGGPSRVHGMRVFAGRLPLPDFETELAAAALVPIPYTEASQSALLMKVLGAGRIPLCSNLPAFHEVLGSSLMKRLSFTPGSPEALTAKIDEAVGWTRQERMEISGDLARVRRRLSWSNVGRQWVRLLGS
jgi:glycosyltransferase involved in cell wall biosynthesis